MPFCCKCGRAPLVERVRFDFVENRQGLKKFYCQRVAAVPSIRASAPLDRGNLGCGPRFHGDVLMRSKLAVLRLDLGSLQGIEGSSFLV